MGRKRGYDRKPFESARPGSGGHDRYVGLYDSMTESPAWRDLSANQRDLYRICRKQYMRREPARRYPAYKSFDRDEVFFLSWGRAKAESAQGESAFYRDMKVLVEHGFINMLLQGERKRETVYELSDQWRFWKKGMTKAKQKGE